MRPRVQKYKSAFKGQEMPELNQILTLFKGHLGSEMLKNANSGRLAGY